MGTTLSNGVYLPDEGERNCYAGLKVNWEILNQKVADIRALQLAIAGALHREIVASLPTTDINPNTIYMILNGTSATENVYDEYMYVNNAWELIGTSATDLTNYYTKAEVDGKLLLKANASDLTSHTGDTTIHVTASDKTKWTNSANTHVLRLALSALTPSTSGNSFSNLDDSTALKVGDKVMDTAGVLFEVTAIDTQNSTFTIGTALIDLAQDSDVVHKSGDETIGGRKTFSESITCFSNSDAKSIICKTPLSTYDSTNTVGDNTKIRFLDKNNNSISYIMQRKLTNGSTDISLNVSNTDSNNQPIEATLTFILDSANEPRLSPGIDNTISLGRSAFRYKSFYGMNYYYGSNNVEFSTKFVTTDTAQTITATKTFDGVDINFKSNNAEYSVTGGYKDIFFLDKNSTRLAYFRQGVYSSGLSYQTFNILGYDSNNQQVSQSITFSSGNLGLSTAFLKPDTDNAIALGRSNYKWSDVQTYKVNGVEPSSLSLPSSSGTIDISSYITDLTGVSVNYYTPLANGYIVITCNANDVDYIKMSNNLDFVSVVDNTNNQFTSGILGVWQPCIANIGIQIRIKSSALKSARFIPCQGNV